MQKKQKKRTEKLLAIALFIIFHGTVYAAGIFILPTAVYATENTPLSTEPPQEDIISIACPLIGEEETSPFHFILDPQGLIYETNAMRYGGGSVEEGATLLFRNQNGEYDFSKNSDFLTVTNYSTVPVVVTVSAQICDLGEIGLAVSEDFSDMDVCSLYLAVLDSAGNVQPLSAEGEVSIAFELRPAPENAYIYKPDGTAQAYHYELSENMDNSGFDTFSFGLTGACNANADWANVNVHPVVTVTWHAEPVLTGTEAVSEGDDSDIQNESIVVEEETSEGENHEAGSADTFEADGALEGENSSTEDTDIQKSEESPKGEIASAENIGALELEESPEGESNSAVNTDTYESEEFSEGEGGLENRSVPVPTDLPENEFE